MSAAAELLAWHAAAGRDVPWRHERDPYRIWVAEVMAQQTRLPVVHRYLEEFLGRFPDVAALAGASLNEVLKKWEGLGYYTRARNLHRAAKQIIAEHGGVLPSDPRTLRSLPGIGPYTAGAIASLAFGLRVPAVDGNARRVLSRLYDVARPRHRELEERASELIAASGGRAAAVNQALMDLGGVLCTPRSPSCGRCPLHARCLAARRGTVASRPARATRRPTPHYRVAVGVVWNSKRVLIARRPEEGLLGGLWEFPGGKIRSGESVEEAVRRELQEEMGIEVSVGERVARVEHAYSHFRITLFAHHAHHECGRIQAASATEWRWVSPDGLAEFAFPAANQRIIDELLSAPQPAYGIP